MAATINSTNALRDSILDIRMINYELRPFVPQDDLYRLLTLPVISSVLEYSGIDKGRLSDLARTVYQSARRVFATLVIIQQVQHVIALIGHDQFGQLDQQLPFDQVSLSEKLPGNPIVRDVCEQQWQFLAPIFSKTILPRELIYPYQSPREPELAVVALEQPTRSGSTPRTILSVEVWKAVADEGARGDYEKEAFFLTILSHLRHPYILELFTAFTHSNEHHLIFPWAPDGDLAGLLRRSVSEFRSHKEWIVALCHLASAIESIHNSTAEPILDLQLIGYHHDLKPPNILVKGKTLILADFGLSKFRDITKQSATRHQIGQGDYLAPECEELEGNFAKGIIGRSSDIWSFGVIMAEILTHLFKGASGVKAFREMRRYQLGNFFFSHFHHGPGAPNPAVAIWFSRLENEALAIPMFLPLIREMLPVKPTQRPKAIEVQARLQLIAVRLFASEINQQYNIACDRAGAVNAWIENWRFESWSHSRKAIRAEEASAMAERKGFEHDFDATFDILDRIHDQLHSIGLADRKGLERAFFPLRYLNNCLSELLPVSQQKEMQETFEHKILSIEDVQRLRDIGEALRTQKQGEHPARLAAIKRMTILAEQHLSLMHSDLMIGPNKVRPAQKCVKLRSGEVMTMEKGEGTEIVSVPVVVEWVLHDSHISEQVGHERLLSIDALATMLSLEDKPEEFRVLRCSAYFHDPHEPRSGLVFAIPTAPAVSEAPEVISLADLFRRDGTATGQRPALGDKFRLAVALTTSIAEFHKVGWLHKNISSANIVFFLRAGSSPETQITKPYIVGFNHSRLIIGITEGSYDIKYKDYQHPGYLRNELRFNFKFDYYSLGLGSARDWILAIA